MLNIFKLNLKQNSLSDNISYKIKLFNVLKNQTFVLENQYVIDSG